MTKKPDVLKYAEEVRAWIIYRNDKAGWKGNPPKEPMSIIEFIRLCRDWNLKNTEKQKDESNR